MTKFFYFKVTFLSWFAGIFVGMLVYGLFDSDFTADAVLKLVFKSFATAASTALFLGILNMYFKIGSFKQQDR